MYYNQYKDRSESKSERLKIMKIDNVKIGKYIARLRADKGITQNELGERIGVSFQAVSKWERGETLPDISVLPDLADILETTADSILSGGEHQAIFTGRIKVKDMIDGINCLRQMGELLGRDNIIYRCAVDGINSGMQTDIEPAFDDDYYFEAFVAEAIIQNLAEGQYVDITDVNRNFKHEHFREIVKKFARKYNIT